MGDTARVGGVGWPTRRAGRARETLPESQECWEAFLESHEGSGGLGGVGSHPKEGWEEKEAFLERRNSSGGTDRVRSPSRRGQEAFEVRRAESKCPPGGTGVVGKPSRSAGSGKQALQEERKNLGGPPGELGQFKRPTKRPGRGWVVWERSGVHLCGLGRFRRSFQRDGRGQGPSRRGGKGSEARPGG